MHSNSALAFACKIIREHYGELCEAICKLLVSKGLQTQPNLLRSSGLPMLVAKQALLAICKQVVSKGLQTLPDLLPSSGLTMSEAKQALLAICKQLVSKGPQTLHELQLVSKGLQTLHELVRSTGLPMSSAKQALLVLLQHNWVSAYLQVSDPTIKGGRPPYHLYLAHVDSIIQIVRMPKFLLHIKEEMDETAEFIVQLMQQHGRLRAAEYTVQLMQPHGRLTVEQIIKGVAGRMQQPPEELREVIRNTFISLVQSHYIERVPTCSIPVPK
eukprot:gene5373-5593_t